MNNRSLAFATALLTLSGLAQAHTHLEMATPADNSSVASSPSQIVLHFSEATRLTALSIQKEGEQGAKNVSSLPQERAAALSVPIEPLTPGKYVVSWRVVGADNHVMAGTLHFTVSGK